MKKVLLSLVLVGLTTSAMAHSSRGSVTPVTDRATAVSTHEATMPVTGRQNAVSGHEMSSNQESPETQDMN